MVELSSNVTYIQEPFNTSYFNAGVCGARFKTTFPYVTQENEEAYYPHFQKTLQFSYNWKEALRENKQLRHIPGLLKTGHAFNNNGRQGKRPLLKDPFAVFSAEWLADRFGAKVVVLVRHPAAFVGSIKRYQWHYPYHQLLAQPLLMRDHLQPYRADIESFSERDISVVEDGAMLWRLINSVVYTFSQKRTDWLFVRHEDLSRDPVTGFEQIYSFLDLSFTQEIRAAIDAYSNEKNPESAPLYQSAYKLNSQANIWNWKTRLTQEEIATVRQISGDVASHFYTEEDW